jgi:hypothetical protein
MKVVRVACNWGSADSGEYHKYIGKLQGMIDTARDTVGDANLEKFLTPMEAVLDKIVVIRQTEFRQKQYFGQAILDNLFTTEVDREKFLIRTNSVDDPSGKNRKLDVVDIYATIGDDYNQGMLQDSLGADWRDKFMQFFLNYGSSTEKWDGWNPKPTFDEAAKQHRNVLTAWTKTLASSHARLCS